ncbi:putative plastid-lipid-associated protein 13, chloroplastic [Cucurbita argyrosperma subsp. argyrosperma]|nr:putative plastid-lipid-associated protein 13, chloroplastic [Cucurbita argyrosperma subsp. argyrosperma]
MFVHTNSKSSLLYVSFTLLSFIFVVSNVEQLFQFKDAGGFEALVTGKTTDIQRIDVNERITGLERLNPTSRPTTSPFLEGRWNFEWFGSGSPGFAATRFPSTLANLSKLDAFIKDGTARITANFKLLNAIESKVILSTKLSVEGPLRLKEEYIEGILETPSVSEQAVPEQLKGTFNQAVNTMQQLPVPIKDVLASGLKIIRDTSGVPEVLTRLESPPSPLEPSMTDYES